MTKTEILYVLTHPRVFIDTVHDFGCAATKYGKKRGPCNCPAQSIQSNMEKVQEWISS